MEALGDFWNRLYTAALPHQLKLSIADHFQGKFVYQKLVASVLSPSKDIQDHTANQMISR